MNIKKALFTIYSSYYNYLQIKIQNLVLFQRHFTTLLSSIREKRVP